MKLRWWDPIAVALVVSACATAEPPGAVPSASRSALAEQHRARALQLERDGALRAAVDEWKITRALGAGDAQARDAQARLEALIDKHVTERIAEAKAALARGSHAEAQRRLLRALALDPGNRTAMTMLRTEVRDVEFVSHTVRPGETLAILAERYYGDRSRSEVIWETNQLPPNPRLQAGTTLKIPEIPGMPFPRRKEPPPSLVTPAPAPAPAPGPAPARVEPTPHEEGVQEVNPLLAEARESLERNDYPTALGDVEKLLASEPGSREGLDLKKMVLYRQGKSQLDQKNYDASYKTLSVLAKLQPDYEDVSKLVPQTKARAIEQHYQTGIRLYREEKLPEAVAEWKVVLELDPQHANAKRNIDQAEKLLRGLEQRKKK